MSSGLKVRILSVVGARPQFIKLAPVSREIRRRCTEGAERIDDFVVHTGQHYDASMSNVFFHELDLPPPAVNLGVGSGAHGEQTGKMIAGLEAVMLESRPTAVVVYGDTNSTVAGALAASKIHLPVLHVESGLRSFNRTMPEEINRIVADHVCDRLLAPTSNAIHNLEREGLAPRSVLTGDVMQDAVLFYAESANRKSTIRLRLELGQGGYLVATVHRAENTSPEALRRLLSVIDSAARHWLPVIFPVHPRTAEVIRSNLADWSPGPRFRMIPPLGYLDMIALVHGSACVITDSGGLQKEAAFLGRPCITLRDETEWTETVEAGANLLAGADGREFDECVRHWSSAGDASIAQSVAAASRSFGSGEAARLIVDEVLALCRESEK